jgi:Helix-turn-helix domain
MERLLLPREVAQLLGIKIDTLRIWRARGRGPSYCKIGKLCRYSPVALEVFVKKNDHSTDTRQQPADPLLADDLSPIPRSKRRAR